MIKPLRGYVLVEELEDDLKTASGIALPESTKDKPIKGIVLAVGLEQFMDGGRFLDCEAKIGNKVVYKRWSTTNLDEDGKKLAFVKFEDILGCYED